MIFSTTVQVLWADTDAARIVWYGNYLRYIEAAENAMFAALAASLSDLVVRHQILFPRTSLACQFRSPARFEDVLSVKLRIASVTERRARLEFTIQQHASEQVVAEGSYEIACVDDRTFQGRPWPTEVHALLARAVQP